MAKSDSTRKPKLKLPKRIWVECYRALGRVLAHRASVTRISPTRSTWVGIYAPVQPPRRCVWRKHGQTRTETSCGLSLWDDPAFLCCYNCGGKIVRRKA